MIPGVQPVILHPNSDRRGWLTEVWRVDRMQHVPCAQLNIMHSVAGSMRGCHVHLKHWDFFVMGRGKALVGMFDVRNNCALAAEVFEIDEKTGLVMPPGVIHAVYFPKDAELVTVESMLYDPEDEIKVNLMDPELTIPWPPDVQATAMPDKGGVSVSRVREMLAPHSFPA